MNKIELGMSNISKKPFINVDGFLFLAMRKDYCPIFSVGSLAALLFFQVLVGCSQRKEEPKKPNIVFIFTDDQRADALGAAGNQIIKTPNLDALAESGVRFTNNYCMGSIHGAVCAPSRAMLMSGKSLYHVYDKLDTVATMPQVLAANGYTTFGTGKWHNGGNSFLASFQQGKNVFLGGMDDHFNTTVRDKVNDSTFTEPIEKGFSTDLFADAMIDFITSQKGAEKPFFAYIAFTAPHDPRSPLPQYLEQYDGDTVPLPANFKPFHPFNFGEINEMQVRDEHLAPWPRDPGVIQDQLREYYAMITHADKRIGDIITSIEASGFADNTIIVYAADHGLALGSHGLVGKQSLYEHSMKAPLVFAGPGLPANETRDALVYLYDIFPTLCNLTGVEAPEGVDGKDLSKVIVGKEGGVRTSLFTTYRGTHRAVRDKKWKLIRYPMIDYTQLFDLENDPDELVNLAGEKEHEVKVREMMGLLSSWQRRSDDTVQLTAKTIVPMEYDPTTFGRKPDVHQPPFVVEKYFKDYIDQQ
jgi:arylsulfatase A-like enzyme